MNIKLNNIITYREYILCSLIILVFFSFTVSYALNSISVFLFLPLFFIDTKQNIIDKIHNIKNNRLIILYVLFFLIQLLGFFYSDNKNFALKKIAIMFPLLFIPAILSVEKISKKKQQALLSFLKYIIVLTFSVYLFIHTIIDNRNINTFVYFAINGKIEVSQFYLIFVLMLPFIQAVYEIKNKKFIILNTLILIASFIFILLLGNKTVLIFLIFVGIGFVYRLWKVSKKKSFLFFLIFISLIMLISRVPVIKNRANVFLKTTDFDIKTIITKNKYTQTKNTAEHRVLIDYLVLNEIVKSLPFGVGTGDYQDILNIQYERINFKVAKINQLNTHNQYLCEFMKTGVLGGLVFILIIFNLWKKSQNHIGFYFVLMFSLGCLVESYLDRQHGVVIFAFIIPFILKIDNKFFKLN